VNTPTPESTSPSRRRRRLLKWSLSALVVIAIFTGAFVWWFFRGDAPDAVSIGDAAAQVQDAGSSTIDTAVTTDSSPTQATAEQPAAEDSATNGVAGTWTVDSSVGEFSYEDSTGTFVGFRVDEELSGIGSTTAVGRTPEITGTLVVAGTTVTAVTIEADMTAITTDESRRDDKVQDALDTGQFPTATFELTQPIELGDAAASGAPVSVEASGELTIHGVTTPVSIPLEAQLVGDHVVVVGSLDIVFADYGVSVPSAPVVLSAEDEGVVELQLFFSRA
jgi:polyisoprenoid-binding protein YceI